MNEDSKSLSPLKYAITETVLSNIRESGGSARDIALVHAFLVEALNAVISMGDIKVIFPHGLGTSEGFSRIIEKSSPVIDPSLAMQIRDRHQEAYNLIQQTLLLKLIED